MGNRCMRRGFHRHIPSNGKWFLFLALKMTLQICIYVTIPSLYVSIWNAKKKRSPDTAFWALLMHLTFSNHLVLYTWLILSGELNS